MSAWYSLVLILGHGLTTIPGTYTIETCHEVGTQWVAQGNSYRGYSCIPQHGNAAGVQPPAKR